MYNLLMGDCLELMGNIPNKSVDMILCDLPYGITAPEWDSILDMNILWKHYERIRKNNCPVVLFSSQPFTTKLISSNMNNFKYCWYWEKNKGTNFFHARRMPMRKIEEICVFYNGKYNPQMSQGHVPLQSSKSRNSGRTYHGNSIVDCKRIGATDRYPTNILKYKSAVICLLYPI